MVRRIYNDQIVLVRRCAAESELASYEEACRWHPRYKPAETRRVRRGNFPNLWILYDSGWCTQYGVLIPAHLTTWTPETNRKGKPATLQQTK